VTYVRVPFDLPYCTVGSEVRYLVSECQSSTAHRPRNAFIPSEAEEFLYGSKSISRIIRSRFIFTLATVTVKFLQLSKEGSIRFGDFPSPLDSLLIFLGRRQSEREAVEVLQCGSVADAHKSHSGIVQKLKFKSLERDEVDVSLCKTARWLRLMCWWTRLR